MTRETLVHRCHLQWFSSEPCVVRKFYKDVEQVSKYQIRSTTQIENSRPSVQIKKETWSLLKRVIDKEKLEEMKEKSTCNASISHTHFFYFCALVLLHSGIIMRTITSGFFTSVYLFREPTCQIYAFRLTGADVPIHWLQTVWYPEALMLYGIGTRLPHHASPYPVP